MNDINDKYMLRALELARHATGTTTPNPMVGAVIVGADGTIIGEGYTSPPGGPHAEVNAVNSVADPKALKDATMYVTLEPCSHWGRTPPCAEMIIRAGIPRVVVGAVDPFDKVSGRGITMLRDAGVEVATGVMAEESRRINAFFFTAHTLRRPFVTLKWAQSRDRYIDIRRDPAVTPPAAISTAVTRLMTHRLRSLHDAVIVGSSTVIADNPRLDTRFWPWRKPLPVILDRRRRIGPEWRVTRSEHLIMSEYNDIASLLSTLYTRHGITSVLVEGGAEVLRSFIASGLWDAARVETSPVVFGDRGGVTAPVLELKPVMGVTVGPNTFSFYSQNELVDVKNL